MQVAEELVYRARDLVDRIQTEENPRIRQRTCRGALDLGRSAISRLDTLSAAQLAEVQETLRVAYRESRGACHTHVQLAKLARAEMQAVGLDALPVLAVSRARRVTTEAASLALTGGTSADGWWDSTLALAAANAGRYMMVGTGYDGCFSVVIRVLDGDSYFLEPKEYARVAGVSPEFAMDASSGWLRFGAAEAIGRGARLEVPAGRYTGCITGLRGARGLRYVATLIRSDAEVAPLEKLTMTEGV